MATQHFSAINTFVQRVRDNLEREGVTAAVGFGWYQKEKQNNRGDSGDRIIFEPSDGTSAGTVGPPRGGPGVFLETMPDGTQKWVRAIYSWERVFAVYVWAGPKEDRESQEEANAALMESVIRAMRYAGSVWVQIGTVSWVKPEVGKQYGREMKVQITLTGNILDVALEPATPDPNSRITRP